VPTIDVQEVKAQLSRLLERVQSGEEIVISENGEPCARLCPLEPGQSRTPGLLQGTVEEAFFEPLPDEELAACKR